MTDSVVSVKEAAEILGRHTSWVSKRAGQGLFQGARKDSDGSTARWRIPRAEVERVVSERPDDGGALKGPQEGDDDLEALADAIIASAKRLKKLVRKRDAEIRSKVAERIVTALREAE